MRGPRARAHAQASFAAVLAAVALPLARAQFAPADIAQFSSQLASTPVAYDAVTRVHSHTLTMRTAGSAAHVLHFNHTSVRGNMTVYLDDVPAVTDVTCDPFDAQNRTQLTIVFNASAASPQAADPGGATIANGTSLFGSKRWGCTFGGTAAAPFALLVVAPPVASGDELTLEAIPHPHWLSAFESLTIVWFAGSARAAGCPRARALAFARGGGRVLGADATVPTQRA